MTPTGMPCRGLLSFPAAASLVRALADLRAPSASTVTQASSLGSSSVIRSRRDSTSSMGVSCPFRIFSSRLGYGESIRLYHYAPSFRGSPAGSSPGSRSMIIHRIGHLGRLNDGLLRRVEVDAQSGCGLEVFPDVFFLRLRQGVPLGEFRLSGYLSNVV